MIKSWIGGNDHEEKNRVSSFRGYLYKLRRSPNMLAPQWGRRWFSIEGHFLRWYRYETDLCAAGMVDLKYVKNIFKTDYMGPTVFTVDCEERTLVLKCNTTTEMNNWIRALHKQADIARGGSGTNLVSDFNQSAVDSSSIKYSRKLNTPSSNKSKMSRLEREIEETLKKLEALEQKVDTEEVDTATQKPSSRESSLKREKETRRRSEEEEMAKIDAEDTMEDSMGDSLTMDVPIRYAKGASSSSASATATTQKTYQQQQQQQHKTPSRSPRDDVDRTGSCSSIEDISLSASKVRRHREKVSKNSSKRLQYGEEPSPPQRHRDIVTGLTNSHNQEEDFIVIEEYPEEDSVRHSNRPMVGHKLRSNSHNNMTAAQNTRRQFLDLEDSHGNNSSQRRRGSGDSLDVNNSSTRNNNSHRSKSDSHNDDRRSGTNQSTFNQWQHQQQLLQHQSQSNPHSNALAQQPAVRRVSKRYEDEDDDDDVSDLLQVRTSKERLPGKFRTATTSSMNANGSNNNTKKGGVKSVESTESLEFVEEDAQYGSAMFYGRHGRDAAVRSSNGNGHIVSENGSKGSKASASNSSSMNNVRTSKQFANLKPAWADS